MLGTALGSCQRRSIRTARLLPSFPRSCLTEISGRWLPMARSGRRRLGSPRSSRGWGFTAHPPISRYFLDGSLGRWVVGSTTFGGNPLVNTFALSSPPDHADRWMRWRPFPFGSLGRWVVGSTTFGGNPLVNTFALSSPPDHADRWMRWRPFPFGSIVPSHTEWCKRAE